MKLNASAMMVAVAMMVGSFGALGCQNSTLSSDNVAPEESIQNAPVESETAKNASSESDTNALRFGFTRYSGRSHYYAPHAPPATRYEVRGVAPSARHFWAPGYYRWNGRQHIWYGGRYEVRRNGYEYIGPRWIVVNGRHAYVPGHWVRRYY
jgi:hypothetical protein